MKALAVLALLAACASAPPAVPPPSPPRAGRPAGPGPAPTLVPPEKAYAGALAAARDAAALHVRDGTDAADLQARLDRKARRVSDALQLANAAIAEQPYAGRAFGHRLIASVLLDLADDLEPLPGVAERVRRYRDEAAASLRRCASFTEPPDIRVECQGRLAALEHPDVGQVIALHRDGLARCVQQAGQGWEGTLRMSVGASAVESVTLVPAPAGVLGACLTAWARSLPLTGPVDVEVPLVLRSME